MVGCAAVLCHGCAMRVPCSGGQSVLSRNPLHHAIAFWKPIMEASELDALARYAVPGEQPEPGINVWTTSGAPAPYVVLHGQTQFSLFAAVHPIETVPDSAEVVAEILDQMPANTTPTCCGSLRTGRWSCPSIPTRPIEAFWYEEYVPREKRTALAQGGALRCTTPSSSRFFILASSTCCAGCVARRAYAGERLLEWPADDSLDRLQRFLLGLIMLASERASCSSAGSGRTRARGPSC